MRDCVCVCVCVCLSNGLFRIKKIYYSEVKFKKKNKEEIAFEADILRRTICKIKPNKKSIWSKCKTNEFVVIVVFEIFGWLSIAMLGLST